MRKGLYPLQIFPHFHVSYKPTANNLYILMKQAITLLLLWFAVTVSFAQTGTIRGTVIDDELGETVIGANVATVDSANFTGTVTDLDGAFTLKLDPGIYTIKVSYVGYDPLIINEVTVTDGKVTLLENLRMREGSQDLEEVVVKAKALRNTETALMTLKKKSPAMLDGISAAKFRVTGDATAVEAAKRITGVSIIGGKYVYVRGLGDRYSKTTLNGVDIPGLDPDRNTIQLDIFPTNLISNMVVSKNFTADLPADFTGGLMNIETKDFPEERILQISVGTEYNPNMHFKSDFPTYDGGNTDFLGFDDGTRGLPDAARQPQIPNPIDPGFTDQEVNDFVKSFSRTLDVNRVTSVLDFGFGLTYGDQFNLKKRDSNIPSDKDPTLGVIFSLSYKSDYTYYTQAINSEWQRIPNPDSFQLRVATEQTGVIGERSFLLGGLAGLAYKAKLFKVRLTAMRLQNGISRAAEFNIFDNAAAAGQSGFRAFSDNLEYNQRSLTNVMLNGTHVTEESGWKIDWRISPTISTSDDPDIRKTAFTIADDGETLTFNPGAGGNPVRLWRFLDEINVAGKIDVVKDFLLFQENANLKFGLSHVYKQRDYEILEYNLQFFSRQPNWPEPDPSLVLVDENIFPDGPVGLQSGNLTPNSNAYNSSVQNTGAYVSTEVAPLRWLRAILGVRAENYVQRHTGRDQIFAQGNTEQGRNLDNEKVLDALDFFPSVNLIFSLNDRNNIRASYSRTIARPSFKELSFAQILDPVSNRIFNGSLFPFSTEDGEVIWDGNLTETRINNFDLRWELFLPRGQIFSISGFYKQFNDPIELVRIALAPTGAEFQPRNVGDGRLFGLELEFRKDLDFISPAFSYFNVSANVTLVQSQIDMSITEFNARKNFERTGEEIDDRRQMAGQAPYVINAGLSYSNPNIGLDAGLFYNVKGRTLDIVGNGLYPDVFVIPYNSLNFSFIKKFGKEDRASIDFRVSNILNDRVESVFESFNADDQFFRSVNPGVGFSLGFSYRLR